MNRVQDFSEKAAAGCLQPGELLTSTGRWEAMLHPGLSPHTGEGGGV